MNWMKSLLSSWKEKAYSTFGKPGAKREEDMNAQELLENFGTPIMPATRPAESMSKEEVEAALQANKEAIETIDEILEIVEPTGDPEVCYSDDCDNSEGIEAHEVRGGKFYLCEYHSKHPERLHFPKPKETDSGGA